MHWVELGENDWVNLEHIVQVVRYGPREACGCDDVNTDGVRVHLYEPADANGYLCFRGERAEAVVRGLRMAVESAGVASDYERFLAMEEQERMRAATVGGVGGTGEMVMPVYREGAVRGVPYTITEGDRDPLDSLFAYDPYCRHGMPSEDGCRDCTTEPSR